MQIALIIIAICSVIRIIQNGIQLFMLLRDTSARDDAYTAFIESLKKDDRQIVEEFLEKAEEYLKENERREFK